MATLEQDAGPLLEGLRFLNGGVLADGKTCEAAKGHTPRPLVLHRVSLTPWYRTPLDVAWVCATDMDLLAMYQQFLYVTNGHVPYNLVNRFAVPLRKLAQRGWDLYCQAEHGK